MKFGFATTIALLAVVMTVEAQTVSKTGTHAGAFLRIPVGSQGSAMGGAVTAHVGDASSMYWNPAGLTYLENNEIMVEYGDWFADIRHNFMGAAFDLGNGTIGVSVDAVTMDEMEERTFDQQDGTGVTFKAYSYAVSVGYAQKLLPQFSLGANVKFIQEAIWNERASTVAFDIGTIYVTPFNDIRFAASITNAGGKMQLDGKDLTTTVDIDQGANGNNGQINSRLETDAFDLPLMLKVGLAYDVIESEQVTTTVTLDGNVPSDNTQSFSVGAEVGLMQDLIYLRGGIPYIGQEDKMYTYTFGGGLNYVLDSGLGLRAGYAFQRHEYLTNINRISLTVLF